MKDERLPKSARAKARLATPTDLDPAAVKEIAGTMNALLADSYALYIKTKNFHWHVSGPHFRSLHLLFDEQAAQIIAATDDIAERVRKLGGMTLKSINQISAMTTVAANEDEYVEPADMLAELIDDNKSFVTALRAAHKLCDEHEDIGSAHLVEDWIDQAELRVWFLYEVHRGMDGAPARG